MAGLGAKTFFLHAVKNSDKTLENLIRGVHFGEDGVQSIMKIGENSFDDYEKFNICPSIPPLALRAKKGNARADVHE